MYKNFLKRLFDAVLSTLALIVLSPIMLILAALIRGKLGAPVIFKQQRPGKDEKIFTLYKFRTMTDRCGKDGELLPDEVRLTKFGKILRSTSLDELPELWNIIKGDMSIVGPRPLLVEYLPLYNEEQRHRHDVRPGLTGLAQVNGRNAISWDEKFRLDIQYVNALTLRGDASIIFQTLWKTLRREGISQAGEATMEAFVGSSVTVKERL